MSIYRMIVSPKKRKTNIYKIYNLEISEKNPDLNCLNNVLCNTEIEKITTTIQDERKFVEVMYSNAVIDQEQEVIIKACEKRGIKVEAAKVSYRYYGEARQNAIINKAIHISFTEEPILTTLKPRGSRKGMRMFDLTKMDNVELFKLSKDRELHLSLEQMQKMVEIQKKLNLPAVTDVFLETFGARWSDHCSHTTWKALGLFQLLKSATQKIKNSNLVSAFIDNAGTWKFFEDLVILFKLETHNSPSEKETYGGQMTKIGGVLRDIFGNGLGAKIIAVLEMTVLKEFIHKRFPVLKKYTLSAKLMAKETIRAIADYGNRMGIPMMLARMFSHPAFGGKVFALGGAIGITTKKDALKGVPRAGDLVGIAGGKTGHDGIHGATTSSGGLTEQTDTGDECHVQEGNPYTQQKMMRASFELRKKKCVRAVNDFGAAGIISAIGELCDVFGDYAGGVIINLALVPLKCIGLENWQIAISESQERMAYIIKPEKLEEAKKIFARYEIEFTIVGICNGSGKLQIIHNENVKEFAINTPVSGEIALDIPYECFENCPLPKIEIVKPPEKTNTVKFPEINLTNVEEMANLVVGHFDCCNQALAIRQYDSTVQGISFQGPLYGNNYNIASQLAVSKPVFGKNYGLTVSQSFSPWQFEVDPVRAAFNAMVDAVVTQVIAGVKPKDICLADNFYTSDKDPYGYYYLAEQVKTITELSVELLIPFITGKDSSSGSATYEGIIVNVLASVVITAMGKIRNANNLILHQWRSPGNSLFVVGPQAPDISGSILSSSLNITGNKLSNDISMKNVKQYLHQINGLATSGLIQSAVPINRGGLIMRLFEGVEASGFGVKTELCQELFPESFGSVLVEVREQDLKHFLNKKFLFEPLLVGNIIRQKHIKVQNKILNWDAMYQAWNTKFAKEVYSND